MCFRLNDWAARSAQIICIIVADAVGLAILIFRPSLTCPASLPSYSRSASHTISLRSAIGAYARLLHP